MDLRHWNEALFAELVQKGRPDQRLYLYVDRELLAQISGLPPEDAVLALCHVVRPAAGTVPFARAALEGRRWVRTGFDGVPPMLAHLALTVLAVTEVPMGSSNGVYRKQNDLLGLPALAQAPPGYVDHVPNLWHYWNAYLEGPGSQYGKVSAVAHPTYVYQGFARSQAVVRHVDRLRLEEFLVEVAPGSVGPALLGMLEQWLLYRGALTGEMLLHKLKDPAEADVIQHVLDDELDRLRKEGPRPRQASTLLGLLHYDDWTAEFSAVVPVPAAWQGRRVDLEQGAYEVVDDQEFLFLNGVNQEDLLGGGVEQRLAEGVTVRVGGQSVYVLYDEPRVDGRLQCRPTHEGTHYHVLAHDSRVPALTHAWLAAGLQPASRAAHISGWTWFEHLSVLAGGQALRLMGVGAAMPSAVDRPTLLGGLSVGNALYLTGGEPDLLLPVGADASLDDEPLRREPEQTLVRLADPYPDPDLHSVEAGGQTVRFRTVASVREAAVGGQVLRKYKADEVPRFSEPTRSAEEVPGLAGARLQGLPVHRSLVLRRSPEAECLVLTESGDLLELRPRVAGWAQQAGLSSGSLDVLDLVRSLDPRPAYVIVRQARRSGRPPKVGLEVPRDRALRPGRPQTRPRPDLLAELVAERWRWVGIHDRRRLDTVLQEALRRRGGASTAAGWDSPPPAPQSPTRRLVDGPLADNPYDDVLAWVSEQESARVSATRFASAWSWCCHRYDRHEMAGEWRQALVRLVLLGHLERDYARQEGAAAPAALVDLPGVGGLAVLAGARPARLLERLDDPDDTSDAVSAATSNLLVHQRTPVDSRGPLGPTSTYLEWDPGAWDDVEGGLRELGISVAGTVCESLLQHQVTLDEHLRRGLRFSISPGRDVWRMTRLPTGQREWVARTEDRQAGFYRYRLAHGMQFAWRSASGELVRMDPASGHWLVRREEGQHALLEHHVLARVLLVPVALPLPPLLARALVLRTGMPPHLVKGHRPRGNGGGADFLAYDNVDEATAERVAALLGQGGTGTDYEPLGDPK